MSFKTWNYRVLKIARDGNTPEYGIVEAHYDDDNVLIAYTSSFIEPWGETTEELENVLNKMKEALNKPVIDEDEFLKSKLII